MKTIQNFFLKTYGVYKPCKRPVRNPDFESPSGSQYWFGENKNGKYIIRSSNHWGKAKGCYWDLKNAETYRLEEPVCGKIYLHQFKKRK